MPDRLLSGMATAGGSHGGTMKLSRVCLTEYSLRAVCGSPARRLTAVHREPRTNDGAYHTVLFAHIFRRGIARLHVPPPEQYVEHLFAVSGTRRAILIKRTRRGSKPNDPIQTGRCLQSSPSLYGVYRVAWHCFFKCVESQQQHQQQQ